MLAELPLRAYLERTASGDPVPGGGSAAALNGALAAALIEMVARLTIGRAKFEGVDADMRQTAAAAAAERRKLEGDIDRDAEAYRRVLGAFQMPKSTAEEKAARYRAVQEAFQQAALVPLAVARSAVALLELGRTVIVKGNPNAASDGAAGVLAARTAVRAAVYNVRINLAAITDNAFAADLRREADGLEAAAEAQEREILSLLKIG